MYTFLSMPMARSAGKSLCEIGTSDHLFKLDRHTLCEARRVPADSWMPRAGEFEHGGNYAHVTVATHRQNCEDWRVNRMLEDVCERIQTLTLALWDAGQLFTKMDVILEQGQIVPQWFLEGYGWNIWYSRPQRVHLSSCYCSDGQFLMHTSAT